MPDTVVFFTLNTGSPRPACTYLQRTLISLQRDEQQLKTEGFCRGNGEMWKRIASPFC